ncbi:hypothetical protein L226DRAFT_158665 [Lentinus tigrinus ALCF2SS1-7]|uniref:REJ domain-containing protein n=1 Tax=Lentinus tigrinus ALCF2SS1-6 TaxID=1328759 RepID=A0A5C2S4Z6_9APHY|nr:hypothetical protein L227DRAFT_194929 [Lentinus tigrinus ALCF2SS1-6]RPD72286.1 hypothetical protein L226DRAFT_158665 [Lentinus tigrinus ALCF2SS1-7]
MRSLAILLLVGIFFVCCTVAQDSSTVDTTASDTALSTDTSLTSPTDTTTSAETSTSSDSSDVSLSTTLSASSAPMTSSTGFLGTSGTILPISPPSTDPTGSPESRSSSRSTRPTGVGSPGLSSSGQNNGSASTGLRASAGVTLLLSVLAAGYIGLVVC